MNDRGSDAASGILDSRFPFLIFGVSRGSPQQRWLDRGTLSFSTGIPFRLWPNVELRILKVCVPTEQKAGCLTEGASGREFVMCWMRRASVRGVTSATCSRVQQAGDRCQQ